MLVGSIRHAERLSSRRSAKARGNLRRADVEDKLYEFEYRAARTARSGISSNAAIPRSDGARSNSSTLQEQSIRIRMNSSASPLGSRPNSRNWRSESPELIGSFRWDLCRKTANGSMDLLVSCSRRSFARIRRPTRREYLNAVSDEARCSTVQSPSRGDDRGTVIAQIGSFRWDLRQNGGHQSTIFTKSSEVSSGRSWLRPMARSDIILERGDTAIRRDGKVSSSWAPCRTSPSRGDRSRAGRGAAHRQGRQFPLGSRNRANGLPAAMEFARIYG